MKNKNYFVKCDINSTVSFKNYIYTFNTSILRPMGHAKEQIRYLENIYSFLSITLHYCPMAYYTALLQIFETGQQRENMVMFSM
jgi:hypothetical protein